MQSLITNGYTATEITNALLAKSGVVERAFRFELLDEDNSVIRETTSIIGGNIKHVHSQRIKRGGSVQIDENLFTLTSDYLDPNASDNYELEMPTLSVQVLNEQPILFWRFGDTAGTTADDAAGTRDGTYQNTPSLNQTPLPVGDQTNASVKTNGTDEYVSRASESAFNVATFSWEIWFSTTDTGVLISRDDRSTNRYAELLINASGYIEANLRFTTPATGNYIATAKVNDGLTHYVVITYNGSFVSIYIDGRRVLKTAETRTLASPTVALNVARSVANADYLAATLDEFAYYGYALSYNQIRNRWQAGSNQLYEIDFIRYRLKIWCAVKMETAGDDGTFWAEFPLGVFKFIYPDRSAASTGATYDCQIQDLTSVLDQTKISVAPYRRGAASYTYRTAIQSILSDAGFSAGQYALTTSTAMETSLPSDRVWKVGTSRLDMVNQLLKEVDYRDIYMNSNGVLILEPRVSPVSRVAEFTYTPDGNSIIIDDYSQSVNLSETFNQVIGSRTDAKANILYATASNYNASHPTSIPSVGYAITYYQEGIDAADQTALTGIVQGLLEEKAAITYTLVFRTPLVPIHEDWDRLRIPGLPKPPLLSAVSDAELQEFVEEDWSILLDDTGEMSHTASIVLSVS
jgi:hypothetical protein